MEFPWMGRMLLTKEGERLCSGLPTYTAVRAAASICSSLRASRSLGLESGRRGGILL